MLVLLFGRNKRLLSYDSYSKLFLFIKYGLSDMSVLLPKTSFPRHLDKIKETRRNEEIQDRLSTLHSWQQKNNKGKLFILHDGPPYANGELHLGHAVNKITKDITNRYRILSGWKVHYVPGWDCHGLPIELQAIDKDRKDHTSLQIREKARKLAQNTIEQQMASFLKWGILGDWGKSYKTYDPEYIIRQIEVFYLFYEKGLIFRDYKPVYWSPSNGTALAEAELEYNQQHASLSAYVKFPLNDIPELLKGYIKNCSLFIPIWTTTPWTLPANQAIGFTSDKNYSLVKFKEKEFLIVASELVSELQNTLKTELNILKTFPGVILKGLTYSHPLYNDSKFKLIENPYVTMIKGTGLVHMAPNHGHEDYAIALKHQMPLTESLVDENGCFTEKSDKKLRGRNVFSDGNEAVLEMLKDNILCTHQYTHSYPYDWRSKQPVIIRTSHQWFFNCDSLRSKAISSLDAVSTYPPAAKKWLQDLIEKCPSWCISRQRVWGVPIPVFYTTDKQIVISKPIVHHLIHLIRKHGTDFWWTLPTNELLPREILEKSHLPLDISYKRGDDILDIWFDSGLSWYNVLPTDSTAEIYIEGIDQIRGWFQSSLWTSIAIKGKAPYKALFVHGFTLDSKGQKMSKSLGNVISPDLIVNGGKNKKVNPPYGIDILRWWVAAHACKHDNILVGNHIIKECDLNVKKIRRVFSFMLGNLQNFNPITDLCPLDSMKLLDRYMLHQLYKFSKQIIEYFEEYKYDNVARLVLNFVTNEISAYYISATRDRLYCEIENSNKRRSCQTALYHTLMVLSSSIAPILPHLSEEVGLCLPNSPEIFHTGWEDLCNSDWVQDDIAKVFQTASSIKNILNKNTDIIHWVNFDAIIHASANLLFCLHQLQTDENSTDSDLCEVLLTSQVTLLNHPPQHIPDDANVQQGQIKMEEENGEKFVDFTVILQPAKLNYCKRCRRYTAKTKDTFCSRCVRVLEAIR